MVVTGLKSSLFSLATPRIPPLALEKRSLFLIHPSTVFNVTTRYRGNGKECLPLIHTKVPYKPCVCTGPRTWDQEGKGLPCLVLTLSSKDDAGPKVIEALMLILNI